MIRSSLSRLGLLAGLVPGAVGAQMARAVTPAPEPWSSPLPADAPIHARRGLWFGAGLGAGAASLHCQICSGEQETRGTSGYLRVGTTVNGRFLVGAEVNGWMRSDQSGRQRVVALTGDAYWYPNPRHGYYVKGGFGISRYRQWAQEENDQDVTVGLGTNGLAGQVGVGYEIRVNPRMSLVPYLNLVGTAKGALSTERDDGTRFERNRLPNGANVLLVQLGMGLTWH